MVFCQISDKVSFEKGKWSKIVLMWSKKSKEVFM